MIDDRIPIVICLSDTISGAVSWALRLREEFRNHPKYKVLLLGRDVEALNQEFDLILSEKESNKYSAYFLLKQFPRAIVAPNWLWNLFPTCAKLNSKGRKIACIGFCRSDSEEEYYANLVKYESFIYHFIAVSPECGLELRQRLVHRVNEISVLPTGVFTPENLVRSYSSQPIRIIYGGRIEQRQKRVMDFVPLVKLLLAHRINFIFSIVGDGSYLLPLMQAMRVCKHAGRVRFFGRLSYEEMNEVWREHDVFIQMSDFEGTSNSMLEAMSQGTVPIVATASSGVRGIINHQRNGFMFPVGDINSFASTIGLLAEQNELLSGMGKHANQTAQQFSMALYIEKFIDILDKIVYSAHL
jgi:glycosyltransferase involved in cell wall biosynthesis